MRVSGYKGIVFLLFNLLFCLVGAGVMGYAIWILVSTGNTSNFLKGTLIFTYSLMFIGLFITTTGVIGCIGGIAESTCCLKTYIGLMTALLVVDISVAVAGYVQRQNVFDLTDQMWDEVNDDTKNHIQTELECCGYSNYTTEYGTDIPSSCYQGNNNTGLYQKSCEEAMEDWIRAKIIVWASVIGSIVLVQIISGVFACLVLRKVEEGLQVSDKGYIRHCPQPAQKRAANLK